jgi:hypothetical protein
LKKIKIKIYEKVWNNGINRNNGIVKLRKGIQTQQHLLSMKIQQLSKRLVQLLLELLAQQK